MVGATSESLARGFEAHGIGRARLSFHARPFDGAAALVGDLRAGDVVALFLHDDRAEVEDLLSARAAEGENGGAEGGSGRIAN